MCCGSTPGRDTVFLQELLPDHLLKEAKAAADRTKGQWSFGWGKKKEPNPEPAPAPDAETLKVGPNFAIDQYVENQSVGQSICSVLSCLHVHVLFTTGCMHAI